MVQSFPWTIILYEIPPASTFYTATETKQKAPEVHKKSAVSQTDEKLREVTSGLGQPSVCQICDKNTNTEAACGSHGNQINLKPVLVHKRESLYFESTKTRPRTLQDFRSLTGEGMTYNRAVRCPISVPIHTSALTRSRSS